MIRFAFESEMGGTSWRYLGDVRLIKLLFGNCKKEQTLARRQCKM
jgi:hypothetical protein